MKAIKELKITYNPHLIPSSSSSPDQLRGSTATVDKSSNANPSAGPKDTQSDKTQSPKK